MDKGARILLVDDQVIVVVSLQTQMNAEGYSNVEIAADGAGALRICRSRHVDLVLLDVLMPGDLDGIELGGILNRESPDTRIVFMSATDDSNTLREIDTIAHQAFVSKPYENAYVIRTIEACLGGRQPLRRPGSSPDAPIRV